MPLWALAVLACCYFFSSTAYAQTIDPNNDCPITTFSGTGTENAMIDNRGDRNYAVAPSSLQCKTLDLNGNVGYIVEETMGTDANGDPVAVYSETDGSYTFAQNTLSNKIISSTLAINLSLIHI